MQAHHIQIKLFATLNRLLPENAAHYPVAPGTRVADIIEKLRIPQKEAKLIFINSKKADPETVLQNGDRLGIFPPVGGG